MSQKVLSARVQDHFQSLPDPRRREVVYPLINIVMIAVCAVICGADDFVAIAEFGRQKKKWFAKFLDLGAGIPGTTVARWEGEGDPCAGAPRVQGDVLLPSEERTFR